MRIALSSMCEFRDMNRRPNYYNLKLIFQLNLIKQIQTVNLRCVQNFGVCCLEFVCLLPETSTVTENRSTLATFM